MTPQVLAVGLCSPLGLDAEVNQVEFAAGSLRFGETGVLDLDREPVRAAFMSRKWDGRTRTARLAALAARALRDCVRHLDPRRAGEVPLFLGLPAPTSGGGVAVRPLLAKLARSMPPGATLQAAPEQLFAEGRTAFFRALEAACRWVEVRGGVALVGAADSQCDRRTLTHLARAGRTLGFNPDGLIPGEAAGFVLVGREGALPEVGPALRVVASASGQEARHFLQDEPNLAAGLTAVFRSLWREAEAGGWRADYLISCQTGEGFWANEFGLAYLRNGRLFPEPLRGNLTAEWLGDVGAAAGVVALVAAQDWVRRHGGRKRVLLYGCSDEGLIGACIVEGA